MSRPRDGRYDLNLLGGAGASPGSIPVWDGVRWVPFTLLASGGLVISTDWDARTLTFDAVGTGNYGEADPLPVTSGLRSWYSASAINGIGVAQPNDGDLISQWNDLSGNDYHATATGTVRPAFRSSTLSIGQPNDMPAVEFDGNDYLSALSGWDGSTNTEYTLFLVIARIVGGSGDVRPFGAGDSASGTHAPDLYNLATGNLGNYWPLRAGGTSSANDINMSGTFTPASSTFYDYSLVVGSGGAEAFVDGTSHGTSGATVIRPTSTLVLGASGDTGLPFTGAMAECVVFDRKLNGTERADMEDYLRTKYGTA